MIPLTVAAASSIAVKSSSSVRTRGGFGHEPHRDRGGDAHRALAADEAAAQVVARLVGLEAAEPRDGAVGQHDLDREHVRRDVTPDARQCGPPALVADVAADRARLLRRRVGRVVQPEVRDRPREVEVEHARLDPREALVGVDLEDAVHLRGHDDDRVVDRRRAAREAGAAPPRHERPVVAAPRRARCSRPRRPSSGSTPRPARPRSTPASRA